MFRCSRCLLVTCCFLSMLSGVHLQQCLDEKRPAKTSNVHEEVVFQSGAYDYDYLAAFEFRRRGAIVILRFDVKHDRLARVRSVFKNISVEVQIGDKPEHIDHTTITMRDVQESDSGDYTLYDWFNGNLVDCWRLYVLGEGAPSATYYEEGTILNLTDLPHLSDEVVERMNITTYWLLDNTEINDDNILTIDRSMDNKNITYTIQEHNNSITATTFLLRVTYIGPITFAPGKTTYGLRARETIPPIRCTVDCNPKCTVTWTRGCDVISGTEFLDQEVLPDDVVGEYTCHVTNNVSGKQLQTSMIVYYKKDEEQEPNVVVSVLAGLVAVLGLATIILTIHSCRHRFSCKTCYPKKSKPDDVYVGMDNAAANSTAVSNTEGYEDLHIPNNAGDMYDSLNTDGENTISTYENMIV